MRFIAICHFQCYFSIKLNLKVENEELDCVKTSRRNYKMTETILLSLSLLGFHQLP